MKCVCSVTWQTLLISLTSEKLKMKVFFTFWLEERVGNKFILFWIWHTSKAGWKDVSRVSVVSFDWFPGIAVEFGRIFN